MDEDHPLNPRPVRGDEGGRRPPRVLVLRHVRPADRDPAAVQQLRRAPASGEGAPAVHHERALDRPLTIHGDGHASRDWLFVDDDAEAIEATIAADLDLVAGEVINVATGVDISVNEIADLVLEALGKPATLKVNVSERMGQVDRHIGSTEKAKRLLGWEARTSFAEGLERTVAWYRENEAWWRGVLERIRDPAARLDPARASASGHDPRPRCGACAARPARGGARARASRRRGGP